MKIGGAAGVVNTLVVTGVPPVGSRVIRGLIISWNYCEVKHDYGATKDEVASVLDHDHLKTEMTITVQWTDGKSYQYEWDIVNGGK